MDPTQTLIDADQLISETEYAQAIDMIRAYWLWRVRGGFEPQIAGSIRGRILGDEIADTLTGLIIDRAFDGGAR